MINHFFSETVGVTYDIVKTAISMRYAGSETAPAFRKVERSIYKVRRCFGIPEVSSEIPTTDLVNYTTY